MHLESSLRCLVCKWLNHSHSKHLVDVLTSIKIGKYRRADLKAFGAVPEWYVSACIRFPLATP